jgi:hypothetical protein
MNPRLKAAVCCLVSATMLLASAFVVSPPSGAQGREPLTRQAWTLEEAISALSLRPRDAYLQYVALQLARRAGRFDEVESRVGRFIPTNTDARFERRGNADLFGLFTGALAVQESLQLDAMRSVTPRRTQAVTMSTTDFNARNLNTAPPTPAAKRRRTRTRTRRTQRTQSTNANANVNIPVIAPEDPPPLAGPARATRSRDERPVKVSTLNGPTVKSHPWEQMLAGRKPEVSALARSVPEDFYFAEFRTLSKLLDAFDAGDLWGSHIYNQAFREAATLDVGERLKRQLAVETDPQTRPLYDIFVEQVAVTGSDPFVREGSDVTLLFRVKQPLLFRGKMDGFVETAAKARPDAKRTEGQYLGVDYVQLQTPERDISVVSAYPEEGLHVRSNSLAAFRRVVEALKGKTADGRAVRSLGATSEFAYIRTLMPAGDAREDGFVYLSDPFIRRLVGPELKLTERRRLLCYNHLRMTGHAALLFRTEHGRWPASLEELRKADAAPGLFGEGELSCPDGGRYTLSADGTAGVCSRHGHALHMTPNVEAPVAEVSAAEADEYGAFVEEYNQYWRLYFDPIAFRLKVAPDEMRVETIILPLIDNTAYTALRDALGGRAEPLDPLPVPRRNIFSASFRPNKEKFLRDIRAEEERERKEHPTPTPTPDYVAYGYPDEAEARAKTYGLLSEGLGGQVGLHVYDSRPAFDLNLSSALGLLLASGTGRGGRDDFLGGFVPLLALGLVSLNSPVYASVPVADAKVVDDYLDWSDATLSRLARFERRGGWFSFDFDFYKYKLSTGQPARAFSVRFDPLKVRFFWARIGGGVYVATRPFILEDLAALEAGGANAAKPSGGADLTGHALARLRPENWNEVLPDYNLSWAENEREACVNNLGPLSDAARALTARASEAGPSAPAGEALDRAASELAEQLSGSRHVCPEGGAYHVSADGRQVSCSVHGTAADPRQPDAPSDNSAAGRTMRRLSDLSAALTFMDDGLHAVLTVKRK